MGDLVLSNARVLDGRGGIAERATVRVSGGRVAEVLPGADAKAGSGPEGVDLSGKPSGRSPKTTRTLLATPCGHKP
jgi:N-acyl-D-aspartate/D-glutamate deacylase